MAEAPATRGADWAVRVVVPEAHWEVSGAILMDVFGPFELQEGPEDGGGEGRAVGLVFFPGSDAKPGAGPAPAHAEILAALPPEILASGRVHVETYEVARDWVEGWREHFQPVVIGRVRIRPPWAPPLSSAETGRGGRRAGSVADARPGAVAAGGSKPGPPALVDVVINPGLGFGTGLHPTTRGVLRLLQEGTCEPAGALVDAGTGSGVLAIAAARLGWKPVFAFDSDPAAVQSARENIQRNGVHSIVVAEVGDVADAWPEWFAGATVLANMTLEPVAALVRKLALAAPGGSGGTTIAPGPRRLVVSGILAGGQERTLLSLAGRCGFSPGSRLREGEWVGLELLPSPSPGY